MADSGKGEIAVSELDTQQQAQLASAILIHAIPYLWTHGHGREAAQPYLTAPEGVVLNYRGPMDGDPKSSIVVLAPAQTRGQVGWGFPALRGVPRRGGAIDQ